MKVPKELRQYINQRKRYDAKPNGVISWLWDSIERKMATNKAAKRPPPPVDDR